MEKDKIKPLKKKLLDPKRLQVIRVLLYKGKVDWIETTLKTSTVQVGKPLKLGSCTVKEVYRNSGEIFEGEEEKWEGRDD